MNVLDIMKRQEAYASGYEHTPTEEQNRAKQLCWEYNQTAPNESEKRHAIDPEQRSQGIGTSAPIAIEENVWLGANVTVCGGVTIGAGAVIGAGSVVNHDIPANVIAAGVPCKVIRQITEKDKIKPEEILF